MTASRPKILLLGEIVHAHDEWQALNQLGELISPRATNRSEFIEECKSGRLDDVVAAYHTFGCEGTTGRIDEELVAVMPRSWRYLAHYGAGYDQIDPEACSQRDPPLLVSHTPHATVDATADTAMFLIIGALRNFNAGIMKLRQGNFRGDSTTPVALGEDVGGEGDRPAGTGGVGGEGMGQKTLGILGMGNIGRNIKRKAEAFGMRVIYHNRRGPIDHSSHSQVGEKAEYVSFDDLLRLSDVLSINTPLNPQTRHLISTPQFQQMKPTAIIINTARGAIIDEEALVQALDVQMIAGAGLDVYEDEPRVHPGLMRRDEQVLLLPHMGTWTRGTQKKMEISAIQNIASAMRGSGLKDMIPEQVERGVGRIGGVESESESESPRS